MSYIIKDAKGKKIGMLPDSLRVAQAAELRSPAGSRSAAIEAGTQFTVPQYEVGSKGQTSTKITWNIEVATDRDILVRCK